MTYNKNLDLINNIISKLKISSKFDYVENLNLNKIIVYFKEKNFILKISKEKELLVFAQNERDGYLNKDLKKIYNFPEYENIINTNELFVSKIQYLGEKKGNYFEVEKFIKKKNLEINYDTIGLEKYFQKLKDYYFLNDLNNNLKNINFEINLFINQNNIHNVPVELSHGDFIHWNTRKHENKFFNYDLELYNPQRVFCYDIIHWHYMPFIQKLDLIKPKFIKNKLINLFNIYLINLLRKKNSNFTILDYKKFIFLYLFEKKLYYLKILSVENIQCKTTKIYYNQLIYIQKIIQNLNNNFIKKND